MKPCPSCGASCGDDDLFCEADGTRLAAAVSGTAPGESGERSHSSSPTAPPSPVVCASCGAENSDSGDGYCGVCGHRLVRGQGEHRLAVGAKVGPYVVREATADRVTGAAPARIDALLVVGAEGELAHEAAALTALAGNAAFPRVVERGSDETGAFLAVSTPEKGAKSLTDVLEALSFLEMVRAIDAVLDLAAAVEKAGYSFAPSPNDLVSAPKGNVCLIRLRGATPLGEGERLDARKLLAAVGDVFLAPALAGPTPLLRLLLPSRVERSCSIEDVRGDVAHIVQEHAALRGSQTVAQICDQGLWRPYNQDATAVDAGVTVFGDPFVVLVVCDGVSSSAYSERAARTATDTACAVLGHFARSPDVGHEAHAGAVAQAIRAANVAVCAQHVADPVPDPPGTTIVVAFIHRRRMTVGWVGDTRAYWVTARGAELLTHDHSWVNEAIARGEVQDPDEVQGALAHTITKCLGPLEVGDEPAEVEPDVVGHDLAGPGVALLCTDGLWNYAPKAVELGAVVQATWHRADAVDVARLLVNYALARGGQDNVSVAVYTHDWDHR